MNKERIKSLIAAGRLEKAIKMAMEEIQSIEDEQLRNGLLLQSARLKRILQEKNMGTVSAEQSNLEINQITSGVLSLIDEIETINQPGAAKPEKPGQALAGKVFSLTGIKAGTLPPQNIPQITHQLQLYEISKTNLEQAELASAKWGELAPPIIMHRIKEEKQKLEAIIDEIKKLI
ncbi:MAG: hypothetical protein KDD10_01035 [Phaeodactylibacter sp.]|nr:hypothetical protein [Phaeodactylibacter sp.]MCB9296187.1 hypothetical protein [Lewinellaceae bacterium]MCB9298974.1 hypothetical protein [Lewinellaceae bacterium]